ncbi:MAG: rhodanese-like domain-containing protein [Pseudomonadota bacterium]
MSFWTQTLPMLERFPEFAANHPVMVAIFFGLIVALVVTEIRHRTRGFASLSPALLTQLINRADPVLIDVSPANEYERGHIVNARNILPSSVDPTSKPMTDWQDRDVAIYCKNGMVSEQICRRLVKAGFAKVHWLRGGLQSWAGEQLPVTRAR